MGSAGEGRDMAVETAMEKAKQMRKAPRNDTIEESGSRKLWNRNSEAKSSRASNTRGSAPLCRGYLLKPTRTLC